MNGHNKFIAFIVAGLLIVLLVMMCRDVRPPIVTPTLAISETPPDTPEPPTSTPTLVVTDVVLTLPAQATAVTATPPPGTSTAVAPSPTPTVTPTDTVEPTPTPLPLYIVKPGDCLACLSLDWYGTQTRWGDIWNANDRFPRPHEIFPGQQLSRPE